MLSPRPPPNTSNIIHTAPVICWEEATSPTSIKASTIPPVKPLLILDEPVAIKVKDLSTLNQQILVELHKK